MSYNKIYLDSRNNMNIMLSGTSLATEINADPSGGGITDYDGNVYHEIVIGTQTWLIEPLRATHTRAGNSITCYNPNNDVNNCPMYGKLYYWADIAATGTASPAPTGYHVATRADMQALMSYGGFSTSSSSGIHYLLAGNALKATGTTYWSSPNTGALDTYGFRQTGGGFYNGSYSNFQANTWQWVATQQSASNGYAWQYVSSSTEVYEPDGGFGKSDFAFSGVRMLKD